MHSGGEMSRRRLGFMSIPSLVTSNQEGVIIVGWLMMQGSTQQLVKCHHFRVYGEKHDADNPLLKVILQRKFKKQSNQKGIRAH
jgi:hypothetical protein